MGLPIFPAPSFLRGDFTFRRPGKEGFQVHPNFRSGWVGMQKPAAGVDGGGKTRQGSENPEKCCDRCYRSISDLLSTTCVSQCFR